MKPADEFFARVPDTFYPSGTSVGGEWIGEPKEGPYYRRHREAARYPHALLNITHKATGDGELRFSGTSRILALPQ